MSATLGDQIYNKLLEDSSFAQQNPAALEVQREIALKVPETLKDLLKEKVTCHLVLQAKFLFIKGYLEDKLPEKVALANGSPKDVAAKIQKGAEVRLQKRLASLEESVSLLKQDLVSDDIIVRTQMNLSVDALDRYIQGGFTLADLLVLQPAIIVYP